MIPPRQGEIANGEYSLQLASCLLPLLTSPTHAAAEAGVIADGTCLLDASEAIAAFLITTEAGIAETPKKKDGGGHAGHAVLGAEAGQARLWCGGMGGMDEKM